jgi:hypothetical protein
MALRLKIHAAFGDRVANPDPKMVRYDDVLVSLIDSPEKFALFDMVLAIIMHRTMKLPIDPAGASFELAPSSFPPAVHALTIQLIWRVFRYMVLESLSGFVSAVVLVAYIGWLVGPMWKPSLGQLVGRLIGPFVGDTSPRGGGLVLR